MKREFKGIGLQFQIGPTLKVIEHEDDTLACYKCYYYQNDCRCSDISCQPEYRKDNKQVYFIEVEKK